MTYHAVEEMAEDKLRTDDIEHAILVGEVIKRQRDDVRGTKFIIHGEAANKDSAVGVVGRFKETEAFLIITVYRIE